MTSFRARLAAADPRFAAARDHGGDTDLIDLREVYLQDAAAIDARPVIDLIEESTCAVNPGDCVTLTACGVARCVYCGEPQR